MGKYDGFRSGEISFFITSSDNITKQKVVMKPTISDIARFNALSIKKDRTEKDTVGLSDVLVEMILAGIPTTERTDDDKEIIENMVALRQIELIKEFSIAMGWTTREKLEKAIAEAEKEGKGNE